MILASLRTFVAYARLFQFLACGQDCENRCVKNCTGDEANGMLINADETFIHFYRADEKVVAAEG